MKFKIPFFSLIFLIAACGPRQIFINQSGLYPEGLEYDSERDNFVVTSLKEGSVGLVNKKGAYTRLVDDPKLISTIGIRLDKKRNRILVANSDPGVSVKTSAATQRKIAGLGVYELTTGKLIRYVNLSELSPKGNHFANDIALDESTGTAYVTDSFSPIIYKVTEEGTPSIYLKNDRFAGEGFNLNGIVLYKDFLVVAKANEGILFKIPLTEPEKFTEIKIDQKFGGADGLLKDDKGDLVVIANGSLLAVYKLRSDDNFESARVVASDTGNWRFNTTGALYCGKPYVLNAELDQLFNARPDVAKFEIRKVDFKKIN